MNVFAAIAGFLTLVAAGVHILVGSNEFRQFAPAPDSGAARTAWVQALCGWQWVSVSLLAAAIMFLLIAFTDAIAAESAVLVGLSVYFALCGGAWLGTVALVEHGGARRFGKLGQWGFCFLVAVLAYVAA